MQTCATVGDVTVTWKVKCPNGVFLWPPAANLITVIVTGQ